MVCLWFIFLVLSVTRHRPPLSQVLIGTLNDENCHVYSPKAFETIHENVTDITLFIVCKIYFLLVLSKHSNFLSTLCRRNLKMPQSQVAEMLEGQDAIKSKINHAVFHYNNRHIFQCNQLKTTV